MLVLDRLDGDFCKEVVMKKMGGEMRLDRQAFRKEFLVEVLPCLLAHKNAATVLVLLRATGFTHHLKDVHNRVVDIAMLLALVELHSHDNDHVTGNGKAPRSILKTYS